LVTSTVKLMKRLLRSSFVYHNINTNNNHISITSRIFVYLSAVDNAFLLIFFIAVVLICVKIGPMEALKLKSQQKHFFNLLFFQKFSIRSD